MYNNNTFTAWNYKNTLETEVRKLCQIVTEGVMNEHHINQSGQQTILNYHLFTNKITTVGVVADNTHYAINISMNRFECNHN